MTPRDRARFFVPWIAAHASPEQRTALFRRIPPLLLVCRLDLRYYRRFDQAPGRAARPRRPAAPPGRAA